MDQGTYDLKKQEEQKAIQTKETSSFMKKAKSFFNRAKLSRYLGFIAVVVITVVVSLWQVGWDPTRIDKGVFIAYIAVLLFLGVYGLFFGEEEGNNLFKNIITGVYQTVRDLFLDIVDVIKSKAYADSLPDYIVWRYKKDYENTCHMKMLSVRLFDKSILDLTDEQIEELKNHPIEISADKHYKKLSEAQYQVVKDIRDGKIFVDYIDDYNFYLTEDGTDGKQLVTRVKETEDRKVKITWKQRLSRMFLIIIAAVIVAGFFFNLPQAIDPAVLTPEELAAAELAAKAAKIQAAKDLISRITCLVVSVACGMNTARLTNLEDVFVLRYKISYDSVFVGCMDNKTFKPIDVESAAKEEYEQYVKEQEEAKAKVVVPEVVETPPLLEGKSNQLGGN